MCMNTALALHSYILKTHRKSVLHVGELTLQKFCIKVEGGTKKINDLKKVDYNQLPNKVKLNRYK